MHLTPQEKDKLITVTAALLAERRLKRGLRLNHPEAVAWLSFCILEAARDGKTVATVMEEGATWLGRDQVMEGVPELIQEVQMEATFPDGTKLVTLHEPIRSAHAPPVHQPTTPAMSPMIPGELLPEPGVILLNADRPTHQVLVANPGDRPIQVGSHFHFHEVNSVLKFDRESCRGMRLDLPAGTAMRFEPGDERLVRLVPMAGRRRVTGFNGRINGPL